jgi:asparagine synthetase B (glutamine-hydrolysing)
MRLRPGRKSRWNALRRFLAALDLDPLPRYLAWRSLFSADELRRLCAPDFAAEALADDPLEAWTAAIAGLDSRPWVDRAMAIDLADYLPNDCLAKVDIASMRHGLEVRSPFLDHRVVELARRMPVALKWRPRFGRPPLGKAILRDLFGEKGNEAIADCGLNAARATAVPSVVVNPQFAIRNPQFSRCGDDAEKGDRTLFATARKGSSPLFRLPRCVLRRGKMGFGVPVSEWLAGRHAEWMREILLDPPALSRGLLAPRAVEEMIAAHTSRRADHGERLWALVCLELWFRTFRL